MKDPILREHNTHRMQCLGKEKLMKLLQSKGNPSKVFQCLTLSLLVGAGFTAAAQDSTAQQLKGAYLGVAHFGVGTAPFNVDLTVLEQFERRFAGAILPYIEQENLIDVQGTIAASDKCTITSTTGESKATLQLDWLNFGDGGAFLTGELSLDQGISVEFSKPSSGVVAFLRPFRVPGADWSTAVGRQRATLISDLDGSEQGINIDFLAGAPGLLTASLMMDGSVRAFQLVGTSNDQQELLMVGVAGAVDAGPAEIMGISGLLHISERGQPIEVRGRYVRQAGGTGKVIDTGIIAILIGL